MLKSHDHIKSSTTSISNMTLFIFLSTKKLVLAKKYLLVTEQQGYLPSTYAAVAADFWHVLKGIQDEEWGTLCSKGNYIGHVFI